MIIKNTPQPQGTNIKSIVNIFTYEAEHFEEQAINIKKLFYLYKAKTVILDANGIGGGLVDFMILSQIDPETGNTLPPFGVENDEEGRYKKYRTADTEIDAMFLIKANMSTNTEMYTYTKSQLLSGKVKFLIDESNAKSKLMGTKVGQNMSPEQRNEYLRPYVLTDVLKEQILNLKEENEGTNIILKQSTRSIKKDKFSALIYGLYYSKIQEERKRKRSGRKISNLMFFG